jgi:hypothetical protein
MLMVFIAFFLPEPRSAFAHEKDDGAAADADKDADDDAASEGAPLACGGALCDTTNGAECAVNGRTIGAPPADSTCLALLLSALGIALVRRGARSPNRQGDA